MRTAPAQLTQPQIAALKTLATGATVTAAAQAAGVHRSTVYNWVRDNASFSAALRHSKIQAAEVIDDEIRELAGLAIDAIRQLLASEKTPAATRLKAAQYVLHGVAHPALEILVAENKAFEFELTTAHEDSALDAEIAASTNFDIPSAVEKVEKPAPVRQTSTPRNALCPCRSGQKFKRCCGKDAPPVLSAAA